MLRSISLCVLLFLVFLSVAECFWVFLSVSECCGVSRSIAGCYGVGWSIAERCRVFISVGYGFLELPSIACGS